MKKAKWNVFKKNFHFFSNKNVFIDIEFVSSFERVSKLTFQNAFFNKNIFFLKSRKRTKRKRKRTKQKRNQTKQKRNQTKWRRMTNFKKKSNRQNFEFQKFSNCAKKINAKKISKYFYFKFVKFEKKINLKIFARSFVDENEITIRFFFVKRFSKNFFFLKTKRTKISTLAKFRRKKKWRFH